MRSPAATALLSELGLENADVFDSRIFDLKIQVSAFVLLYQRIL